MDSFITKTFPLISFTSIRLSSPGKWLGICLLLFFVHKAIEKEKNTPTWDFMLLASGSLNSHQEFFPKVSIEEKQMIDSLSSLGTFTTSHMIYQDAGNYFLMNSCSLSLYQWNGDHWKIYAEKPVRGATCASKVFFRDHEPYSYSGVGFWQSHGDVFHFSKNAEVELVKTYQQPKDFYGTLRFTTESGLYSFFGHSFNLRTDELDGFLWKGYFLDFSNMHWKEIDFELNENFEKVFGVKTFDKNLYSISSFETDDFALTELRNLDTQQTGLLILEKETLKLWIKPNPNSYFLDLNWLQQEGNTLRFFSIAKPSLTELQIDELVKTAFPLGKVSLREDQAWREILNGYWKELVVVISILVVLFGLGKMILPKPHPIPQASLAILNKEENNLVSILRPYSGQVISQEEMDKILGIDSLINQDLRKVRRSRAIKAINDHGLERHGKPMIQRVRDEQDMRIIRYLIEDEALAKSVNPSESEQLT
ncbi:hypothetical protein ACFPIK_05030 [Algoriphagus aquatilis]|uniref:Uncharacterized protein n=1 Tax=Algoriphagus aquatilis TaxID=490186 RepID=A0ABW0BUW7_9BACT